MGASSNLCVLLLLVSATLRVAHLQVSLGRVNVGNCKLPTIDDIGNSTMLSTEGLLARSFPVTDGGGSARAEVQILDFQYVCQAAGTVRDTVSSISYVARFNIQTTGGVETRTEQFQYDCLNTDNVFSTETLNPGKTSGETNTQSPTATLDTTLALGCGNCVVETVDGVTPNPETHCQACDAACSGVGIENRCVGVFGIRCCNFYENDVCVVACTPPLIPDVMFDCGCGELNVTGAMVEFSNRFLIGSIATQTCDLAAGFVVSANSISPGTRTCTMGGWDGEDIVCERFECLQSDITVPADGRVIYSPTTDPPFFSNAEAQFVCNDGFDLVGDPTRICRSDGWYPETNPTCEIRCQEGDLSIDNGDFTINSDTITIDSIATFFCVDDSFALFGSQTRVCTTSGWDNQNPVCNSIQTGGSSSPCGTGCIIGIVLAILGVIILAAILAGVAYAVYSYMNHPDTKLAKYDPDNINGVAKDNPLYVDPEAVVGDGAEAA